MDAMNPETRFRQVTAELGEHFNDYLVIVRVANGYMSKCSDSSWGLGAAVRYLNDVNDRDHYEILRSIREEE